MKKLYILIGVVVLVIAGYFIHKEYVYRETQKVINEYPEIYELFKKDAEDILGEEFDLTTRKGLDKVKKDGSFEKVEWEVTQNREPNWEISEGNETYDEQVLHTYYFEFRDRLRELIYNFGISSGTY